MTKIKQKRKQFRGIKVVVNYALKNFKLFIFTYFFSFIKFYCTINPYFSNKVVCYLFTTTCFQ